MTMADNPRLRASDADRDRAASLLREHHAAGRLTVEEFSERLDAAYAAKTLGDIDELLADLPSIDLYHLPDESMRRMAQQARPPASAVTAGRRSPAWRAAWGSWASVSMVVFVIWLITVFGSGGGNMHNFWFLWVAGPWGAILLGRWLFGSHPGGTARQLPGAADSRLAELRAQRQAEREAERIQRRERRGDGQGEF
jgi:hypothetical protein